MGVYSCWVTPEAQDRNPFLPIAFLVVAMAAAAGLAMRFGLNTAVAAVCVLIATIGTWLLLAPPVEGLQPAVAGGAGTPIKGRRPNVALSGAEQPGVSRFDSPILGSPRERLQSAPSMAIGFAETPEFGDDPLPEGDDDLFAESAAPVQLLGQLPRDAAAIAVRSDIVPAHERSSSYTLGQFEVRAASRRGSDHVILDELRQDDFVVAQAADGRYLVVVVADGEGTAENAHLGAYWATNLLAQTVDLHLRQGIPGISKMLERTSEEISTLFDLRFTDGTKMRTISTTLVGLIAPLDGGPAAGFRVGDSDILFDTPDGWRSVFGSRPEADTVFPGTVEADVAPIDFDVNCLLLASDSVATPIASNESIAEAYSDGLASAISEVEFSQLMNFPLEEARGDRTAVAVWFKQP